MDWNLVITRNHALLLRIVAELFGMLRGSHGDSCLSEATVPDLGSGPATFTLPRHLYAAILLILRPCESAIRRLIIIAARGLVLKPRVSRSFPAGVTSFAETGIIRAPVFQLIDPLKDFSLDVFDNDPQSSSGFTAPFDTALAYQQAQRAALPVNAALLFNRLRAMRLALNDLPRQARRLARWQARQDLALKANTPYRPMRMSPFRPGPPPGYRRKDIHQVDAVLKDVHYFAVESRKRADSP